MVPLLIMDRRYDSLPFALYDTLNGQSKVTHLLIG